MHRLNAGFTQEPTILAQSRVKRQALLVRRFAVFHDSASHNPAPLYGAAQQPGPYAGCTGTDSACLPPPHCLAKRLA